MNSAERDRAEVAVNALADTTTKYDEHRSGEPARGATRDRRFCWGATVAPSTSDPQQQPSKHSALNATSSSHATDATCSLSFSEAYGVLGVPLVCIVIVCIVWTCWLMLLTFAPTWTVNYLMGTTGMDDCAEWVWICARGAWVPLRAAHDAFLAKPPPHLESPAERLRPHGFVANVFADAFTSVLGVDLATGSSKLGKSVRVLRQEAQGLNVWLKVVDLGMQTFTLVYMLEAGFPDALVYSYTLLIAANAISCIVMIWLGMRHSAFHEVLVDSVFDLLFAVVFPIGILAHCYTNFNSDRDLLELNLAVLPPGSFEQQARAMANPSEIFLFRTSFDSLRVLTLPELVLRVGMNLLFCNRIKRVLEVQVLRRRRARTLLSNQRLRSHSLQGQICVPKYMVIPFAVFSILILVFTYLSVSASASACAYPECVVYARRWNTHDVCPCLTFADVDKTPKTYDEWMHPADKTEVVRQLARSGDLRALQMINRRLPELPDELRRCTELRHMHIEGRLDVPSLDYLPEDLFSGMHTLAFVHLGVHPLLPRLPSFHGLVNAKRISLALLFTIDELPPFESLTRLERLDIVSLAALRRLPDLEPLRNLVELSIIGSYALCCDGFLGTCDLSHVYCTENASLYIPEVSCIDEKQSASSLTNATQRILHANAGSICPFLRKTALDVITKADVDACGGIQFRQCQKQPQSPASGLENASATGICFHIRMQVLACTVDSLKIEVRKQQIRHGLGPKCDPDVEAWLGWK
ncbi:hypothetical protein FI667_g6793, partial [Globisporangium splendens]